MDFQQHRNQGASRLAMKALAIAALFSVLTAMNVGTRGSSRSLLAFTGSSRKLALKTIFTHTTWDKIWETIYAAEKVYEAPQEPFVPPNPADFVRNVGYVITLFHCPGDGYEQGFDTQFDPEKAFYDAAALLKYSIEKNTFPVRSKYNATMHAMIHPAAVRCVGRNGVEYDRASVLMDLGYNVAILGDPIQVNEITNDYVRENINGDSGIRDFLRLRAVNFDFHPIVVLVDFRTFVVRPSDVLFDLFLASDRTIAFPMDYPTHPPSNGQNTAVSLNFVAIKPSATMMDEILESYTHTIYDPTWGWNYKAIRNFDGVLGLGGYLHYFFTRVKPNSVFSMLDRCTYANEAENPMFLDSSGVEACRTPECKDCRTVGIDKIHVLKLGEVCGAPWECHYDENWPALTKSACETFHKLWFTTRLEYEQSIWINGPPPDRDGTYHSNIFLGYCDCEGPACYEVMINDRP